MIKYIMISVIFLLSAAVARGTELPSVGEGRWYAVPMVNQALLDSGYAGGEGCQWLNCVVTGGKDDRLVVMGNDVGGIYRSLDAGKHWEPATLGYNSCGSVAMAIDPVMPDRVLSVGCRGANSGLFLSEDGAETWRQVLKLPLKVCHDYRSQIAFDPHSSFVYWSSRDNGLFRSKDKGCTWASVKGGGFAAAGELAVGIDGRVYIGNKHGLFVSSDHGETWRQVLDVAINSLCAPNSPASAGRIWAINSNAMYIAKSGTERFVQMPISLPESSANNFRFLCVSPHDSRRILMQDDTLSIGKGYSVETWLTEDGGATWMKSIFDKKKNLWGPFNPRQHTFAFSPVNPMKVHSFNADLMYVSDDGGRNFYCESSGYNAILVAGVTMFNVNEPELIAVSSQDYNGGFSLDGGKTWQYINWSKLSWGGFTYGSYLLNSKTAVAGLSAKWVTDKDNRIIIATTHDGGKTIRHTQYVIEGETVGCGAKGDPKRVFLGEWISRDGAVTWKKMQGCTGVYFCDAVTGRLLGVNGKSIVYSDDNGETWSVALDREQEKGKVASLAYDRNANRVYFNYWSWSMHSFVIDSTTAKPEISEVLNGYHHVCGIAVDPVEPSVVYAACYGGDNFNIENCWRSTDGGKTWKGLSRKPNDGRKGPDGANQAHGVTVNPVTREPFVFTHCNGVWRFGK